ncbi:MAG: protein phosphatase 2C domain-containing protein, partial [Armatimonadetes bacterium]|nr:protein phosphatase 2C domain-containing protein [Armatimonadota bacterium]
MRRTLIEAAALTMARAGGDASDNEDSVRYAAGKGHPDAWADFVAVVADGVGTSREPAAAGRAAVETWLQFLERRFTERPEDLAAFDEVQFEHLLRECFAQAHRQVQRLAPGGSATAAGVCIQGPWLLAATVGDARAYHLTEGILHQLTEDQVDSGGNPTDVLGGRAVSPVAAGYAKASISPGDWIVACSDGVIKTLSPEALAALLRAAESPQTAVKALKERVRAQKVDDDVTAVFARVDQVGEPFWAGTGDRGSGIGDQGSGGGGGGGGGLGFSVSDST